MIDRAHMIAENKAYDELVEKGYRPQGYDFEKRKVVVLWRENEHTNNERSEYYYFDNWQEANKSLPKIGA